MDAKKWYHSKILWINIIACIAMIIEAATGNVWLNVEAQVGILAVINLLLRLITKQPLSR